MKDKHGIEPAWAVGDLVMDSQSSTASTQQTVSRTAVSRMANLSHLLWMYRYDLV